MAYYAHTVVGNNSTLFEEVKKAAQTLKVPFLKKSPQKEVIWQFRFWCRQKYRMTLAFLEKRPELKKTTNVTLSFLENTLAHI